MKVADIPVMAVLFSALSLACSKENLDNGTETTTEFMTSGNGSGSVTGAGNGSGGPSTSLPTSDDSTPTSTTVMTNESATLSEGTSCSSGSTDDEPTTHEDCSVWLQDCPDCQKCAAVAVGDEKQWNATQCVEVMGADKPGELCTLGDAANDTDSCIKGAMCFGVNMDGVGTCVALCTGHPADPVCDPPGFCTISADAVLNLCLRDCEPLSQDCPNPSDGCYPVNDNFGCSEKLGDSGKANDPCIFHSDCDAGLMCSEPASVGQGCLVKGGGPDGCCTPFCEFPEGTCPNADQQCVQYFDPMQFPIDDPLLNIGFCGLPP